MIATRGVAWPGRTGGAMAPGRASARCLKGKGSNDAIRAVRLGRSPRFPDMGGIVPSVTSRFSDVRYSADSAGQIWMALVSRNSSSPARPYSRPIPDCL